MSEFNDEDELAQAICKEKPFKIKEIEDTNKMSEGR